MSIEKKLNKYLNEGKIGDKIFKMVQKLVMDDEFEDESQDYWNAMPKKIIDKYAKKNFTSKEYKFYKNNFDLFLPELTKTLGTEIVKYGKRD